MYDATGVIPEELMYIERRKDVRQWLISFPVPGHVKRELLLSWARTVFVKLSEREIVEVMNSGTQP